MIGWTIGQLWYVNLNVNIDDRERNVNVNQVNPDNKFNDNCRVLLG